MQLTTSNQQGELIEGLDVEYVAADKADDAKSLIEWIQDFGIEVVIPPRRNRLDPRDYDRACLGGSLGTTHWQSSPVTK